MSEVSIIDIESDLTANSRTYLILWIGSSKRKQN